MEKSSAPNWAKGFGLPSVPSGERSIGVSCKFINARLEKIALFNFIFLTLKRRIRKSLASLATPEVSPDSPVFMLPSGEVVLGKERWAALSVAEEGPLVVVAETNSPGWSDDLKKKK